MLTVEDLEKLIATRLEEGEILLEKEKFDGAVYISGYAVELSLKLVILKNGFPETADEFKVYAEAKNHNLDILLKLAGRNTLLSDTEFDTDWKLVRGAWSEERRYQKIGKVTAASAKSTVDAIRRIIEMLKK